MLQFIFRKRATNYRALLRKMTCKDKASYVSSPPCTTTCIAVCCSVSFGKEAYYFVVLGDNMSPLLQRTIIHIVVVAQLQLRVLQCAAVCNILQLWGDNLPSIWGGNVL